jgi:hypothetical protein
MATQEEFEKARDEAVALANRLDQFMSEAQVPMRIAEMAITLLVAKLVTVATERDWRTNLHLFAEGVDEAISEREAAARCLN